MTCHIPGESRPYEPQSGNGVELWAGDCNGRSFSVQGERPRAVPDSNRPRPISYSANASIKVGPVQIGAVADRPQAAPGTFSFDEALTTATVSPPPPSHGTATLVRAADGSTSWSGSLSATMLGRRYPLAGPGFESELQSFPMSPGTAYGVIIATGCPHGQAFVPQNPLHRPYLGPLLPSSPR